MRSFKAASSILSPSWMSMARLAFPSRLELNRTEGSFNAAPLGNVILTTFLYVSPVQTMPPWDQMGVPIHFHSSTISGSASCMISRTFASVFPRQSPSPLIFSSINAEADSTGTGLFMYAIVAALSVTCSLGDLGGLAELGRNDSFGRNVQTGILCEQNACQTRTPSIPNSDTGVHRGECKLLIH